jgi:hypothetical protein
MFVNRERVDIASKGMASRFPAVTYTNHACVGGSFTVCICGGNKKQGNGHILSSYFAGRMFAANLVQKMMELDLEKRTREGEEKHTKQLMEKKQKMQEALQQEVRAFAYPYVCMYACMYVCMHVAYAQVTCFI